MKNTKNFMKFIALLLVLSVSVLSISGCSLSKDYSLNKALENSRKASSFSAVTQLSLELDQKVLDDILVDLDSAVFSNNVIKRIIVGSINNPVVISTTRFAKSSTVGQVQASALFTYTELDEYGEISASTNYTLEAWYDYDFSSNESLKSDLYITIPSFDNKTAEIRSKGARYYSVDLLQHPELNKILAVIIGMQTNPNITILNDTFPVDVFLGYLNNTKIDDDTYAVTLSPDQLNQSITLLTNYVLTDDNVKSLLSLFSKESDSQLSDSVRVKEYFHERALKITEHLGFSKNEAGVPAVSYKFTLTKKPFALLNPNAAQYISTRDMEINLNINFRALASMFGITEKAFTIESRMSNDEDLQASENKVTSINEFNFKAVNIPVDSYKVKIKTSTTYVSHNSLGDSGNIGSTRKNTIDINETFSQLYKTKTDTLKNNLLGILRASSKDAVPIADPKDQQGTTANPPAESTPVVTEPPAATTSPLPPPAPAPDPIEVNPVSIKSSITVKGNQIVFAQGAEPVLVSEQIMIPMRTIFDVLGGSVSFEKVNDIGILKGKYKTNEVSLTVNSPTAILNGNIVSISHPMVIINDVTFVPLRFITDAFDLSMDFKKENDVFIININDK